MRNSAHFIAPIIVSLLCRKINNLYCTSLNITNGIIKKDKIIVNSEELIKRVIYQLRLTIDRNNKFLENFRFTNKVDGFYQDVDDFIHRPNQLIVKGSNIIRNWYLVNINDFRIYNYGLTASQVKVLYNNGAINFGPATGAP